MYRIQLDLSSEDMDNLTTHLTQALRAYMTPGFFGEDNTLLASVLRTIKEVDAASDLVEKVE
jgi:hypothetical protein